MSSSTAVFVGDGSLLIQCADAYRQAGHSISAIASHNRNILEWAEQSGLRAFHLDASAPITLPDVDFDFLFSVANLHVLPDELITRARKLAVNFHDALLPGYAGLNATSWALMAQERAHGVTWHEMTAAVDAGRIVRQACFDLADEETALSLNARCYEAGLASFSSIVEDIGRGELTLTEQVGSRTYFARHQRPDALATLDFSRPAKELAGLVRGLDFGQYPNPLARPKIYLGDECLLVQSARTAGKSSFAAPATVLKVDGDAVLIATRDDDILLGGWSDVEGQARPHGMVAGMVLPTVPGALREKLNRQMPRAARGEAFWRQAFAELAPVALPYPQKMALAPMRARPPVRVRLEVPACGAKTVAGFFAWLSALTGQERVSILYSDEVLSAQAQGLENWLSPWVPLTLKTSPQGCALQAIKDAEVQLSKCREAGACPRDLPARLSEKHSAIQGLRKIGLSLSVVPNPGELDILLAIDASGRSLELVADDALFALEVIELMAAHLSSWLTAFDLATGRVADITLLPQQEAALIATMNATSTPFDPVSCVPAAVSAQAARAPELAAISYQGQDFSYRDLDERSTAVAQHLLERGIKPGDIIGLCLERTPDLVVGMLAILKAGAAYLPLDPDYPHDRLVFMIEDSRTPVVVSSAALAASLGIPADKTFLLDAPASSATPGAAALPVLTQESTAYVIYTSGSTGRPKGVIVTHRNVMNFFAGMDARVAHHPPGRWLAVTSLSFDISVLELCWTLTRGFTIVLHSKASPALRQAPDFSLFYFGGDNASTPTDRYRLLLEGAKFADKEGFSAIWTPERHFHAFGGLYPNPALASAAIAAVTTRLKIRAGSCVLPLHHPIRATEDWTFVDNISQGRVGVSFASGWQPNDFVIAPGAFANRKTDFLANIDIVRRLWRGERVDFPGPLGKSVAIQTLPRPLQKELPIWLTAAGNPETFQQAGAMGCHLLTHLLGQSINEVADKLKLYRLAWQQAGHPGQGHVTLMLHTFVGPDEDAVRETVRGPMKDYLRSSVDLIKQAAWSFPAFVQRGAENGKSPVEIMDSEAVSGEDMDALLEHAFSRYYSTSALFGTPARCLELVKKLQDNGVDEIACLIDFGVDTDTVLAHLHDLKGLMDAARKASFTTQRVSVADEILENGVTHLQCTPSMAAMLVADAAGRAALSRLSALMVGGEALPLKLAQELRALLPASFLNMYGPTETTVWSTTCDLRVIGDFVPLGAPIANTRLAVRTPWGMECPALVAGELLIGGTGVTAGYLNRAELTAERFTSDAAEPGSRLYRTGDLVRRHPDGSLEFLGRMDHQVKIRGHRIELGEIESALMRQAGVKEAVVIAREDSFGEKFLLAYATLKPGATLQAEQMRRTLAKELPEVMVPTTVLVLQAFPLTPNGKVDRRALPEIRPAVVAPSALPPESQLEKSIAAIWEEVLGHAPTGTTDNFFDLGGHSLLVVQVQRRLREMTGREISITDMFRLPTIRALAAHLGGNAPRTAVADGLSRAQARRVVMRARPGPQATPTALAEAEDGH